MYCYEKEKKNIIIPKQINNSKLTSCKYRFTPPTKLIWSFGQEQNNNSKGHIYCSFSTRYRFSYLPSCLSSLHDFLRFSFISEKILARWSPHTYQKPIHFMYDPQSMDLWWAGLFLLQLVKLFNAFQQIMCVTHAMLLSAITTSSIINHRWSSRVCNSFTPGNGSLQTCKQSLKNSKRRGKITVASPRLLIILIYNYYYYYI